MCQRAGGGRDGFGTASCIGIEGQSGYQEASSPVTFVGFCIYRIVLARINELLAPATMANSSLIAASRAKHALAWLLQIYVRHGHRRDCSLVRGLKDQQTVTEPRQPLSQVICTWLACIVRTS